MSREPWRVREWQRTTADEMEVELVVASRRPAPGLTELEQRMVVRELTARGVTVEEIARIILTSSRTVYRWRAQDRSEAA